MKLIEYVKGFTSFFGVWLIGSSMTVLLIGDAMFKTAMSIQRYGEVNWLISMLILGALFSAIYGFLHLHRFKYPKG